MTVTSNLSLVSSCDRRVAMSGGGGGGSANEKHVRKYADSWPDGSGTSQADQVWSDDRSLGVGTETHDLQSLTQLDDNGATLRSGINFANVKEVLIRNTLAPGAKGTLRAGNAVANPWDGTGCMFEAAGGTSDLQPRRTPLRTRPPGGAGGAAASDLLLAALGATGTHEIPLNGAPV